MNVEFYKDMGLDVFEIITLGYVDDVKNRSRQAHLDGQELKDDARLAAVVVNSEIYKQAKEKIRNSQQEYVPTEIDL